METHQQLCLTCTPGSHGLSYVNCFFVTRFTNGSYTCRILRHAFHHHLLAMCINPPTARVFNIAEVWTTCFLSGLILKPVWCLRILGLPVNGPIFRWQADSQMWITTRLADEFGYGFNCLVWYVVVKMAPMKVISLAFPCHLMATRLPPPSHPIGE